jgi:hypothetical protein
MRKTLAALLLGVAALPALAQNSPGADLPKFPTPPPPVTAENSVIGPAYADPPEATANVDVPQGDIREFIMYSEDSKIYPGIVRVAAMQRDARGNYVVPTGGLSAPGRYERHVWVYIPRQVKANAPVMVVQDGHSYVKRLANILDNMIAAKRLPAMVVVLPDSGGSDAQGSERGLEYDEVSGRYSDWVETELLPRHHGRFFGCSGRVHHGLVSSRAVSQGSELFGHLREPGLAAGSENAARRLGISRHHFAQGGEEADPHLDGSGREGQPLR